MPRGDVPMGIRLDDEDDMRMSYCLDRLRKSWALKPTKAAVLKLGLKMLYVAMSKHRGPLPLDSDQWIDDNIPDGVL